MKKIPRKTFLQASSMLLAAAVYGAPLPRKNQGPLLSFSTLGCPGWNFQQIIDFAAAQGYQGIELRGIQQEMDLTRCNEFNSLEHISSTLTRIKHKGLQLVNLGSSAALHLSDPVKRKENLDEAKRFIDLAQQVNCPYVRVFPNNLPGDQDKQATLNFIIKGLQELGDYAKGTAVKVLMETHGDLVHTEDLRTIMQASPPRQTGLVWDIANMWTITRESPKEVYHALKPYIFHTHIKDARFINGKLSYTLLGQGEVPVFEAIGLLEKNGYKGYYSFEWEKRWHPELAEPELALADYPAAMKKHWPVH